MHDVCVCVCVLVQTNRGARQDNGSVGNVYGNPFDNKRVSGLAGIELNGLTEAIFAPNTDSDTFLIMLPGLVD